MSQSWPSVAPVRFQTRLGISIFLVRNRRKGRKGRVSRQRVDKLTSNDMCSLPNLTSSSCRPVEFLLGQLASSSLMISDSSTIRRNSSTMSGLIHTVVRDKPNPKKNDVEVSDGLRGGCERAETDCTHSLCGLDCHCDSWSCWHSAIDLGSIRTRETHDRVCPGVRCCTVNVKEDEMASFSVIFPARPCFE